jgi:PhnB protein
MKTNFKPAGFHTVTPYLMVDDVAAFLEFLAKAFDATVVEQVRGPDGKIAHAQAKIGDSMLMAGHANANWKATPASLYLYVEKCDEVYERALAAGAKSLMPPADQFYGDRHGGVTDASGNTWWIATHLEDVPSAELQKRADDAMKKRGSS